MNQAEQVISLFFFNNFHRVTSYRRVRKEMEATNYCVRFGHSLWSAQRVNPPPRLSNVDERKRTIKDSAKMIEWVTRDRRKNSKHAKRVKRNFRPRLSTCLNKPRVIVRAVAVFSLVERLIGMYHSGRSREHDKSINRERRAPGPFSAFVNWGLIGRAYRARKGNADMRGDETRRVEWKAGAKLSTD